MELANGYKAELTGARVEEILVRLGSAVNHSVTPSNIIFHPMASFQYDTFVHAVVIRVSQPFNATVLDAKIDIEDADGIVFAEIDSELLMTEDVSIRYDINRVIRAGSSIGLRSSRSEATGTLICKVLLS